MQDINLKAIKWDEEKNKKLMFTRNISFENVLNAINKGNFYQIEEKHYNQKKYSNQKILFVEILNYIYIVPFIENEKEIFFKTIIPSRKYTKKFLINTKEIS